MVKVYLYPKNDIGTVEFSNPYMLNFEKSLSKYYNIVNKSNNKIGVLDLFRHFFKSDIYIFNWIEDLPFYRYGKLQIIFFVFFLFGVKIFKKRILWMLHNKYSHDIKKNRWTDFMFYLMMKYSDAIITHSSDGIDFAKENFPKFFLKVKYLIHPIQELIPIISQNEKIYDFLIWGVILPYKGIKEFLSFISDSFVFSNYKILIVGKCLNKEYKTQINKFLSENITHFDEFYEIEDVSKFANQSKFILFTHKSVSVLSSGSLMDSIRMGANIIGPNIGAFHDLSKYSFLNTYDSFNEIISIHRNQKTALNPNNKELKDFYYENNWDLFGEKLSKKLSEVL